MAKHRLGEMPDDEQTAPFEGIADIYEEEEPAEKPVEKRVERKVIVASVVTLVLSGVLAVLNGLVADSALLGALPPAWQGIIVTVVPPLLTFLTGYQTQSNRVPVEDEGEEL